MADCVRLPRRRDFNRAEINYEDASDVDTHEAALDSSVRIFLARRDRSADCAWRIRNRSNMSPEFVDGYPAKMKTAPHLG